MLGDYTFYGCEQLKRVTFANDGKLEIIGNYCFGYSAIEEITFPRTLKKICEEALSDSYDLERIYMEDGCCASLCDSRLDDSIPVGPPPETMAGNVRVWDLRNCKHAVIPEGTEKIGNQWFWGSEIESIEISASVKEICTDAFCCCQKLRCVTFTPGS